MSHLFQKYFYQKQTVIADTEMSKSIVDTEMAKSIVDTEMGKTITGIPHVDGCRCVV